MVDRLEKDGKIASSEKLIVKRQDKNIIEFYIILV